jgi:hypothetical protein
VNVSIAESTRNLDFETVQGQIYERYEMRTLENGQYEGVCSTNDPEDRGRPSGFDSWEIRCKTRFEFDKRVGKSRVGINGCVVTVWLDGTKI